MENPLLKDNKKVDLRVYVLIASLNPLVVLYQDGWVKQCILPYEQNIDENDNDWKFKHITNVQFQFQQKYYQINKEIVGELCYSSVKFKDFLKQEKNLGDKELAALNEEAQKIIAYSIMSAKDKLIDRKGSFQLIGVDLILDENLNIKLIELNCNAGLNSDFKCQKYVIPQLIQSNFDLILETQSNLSTLKQKWEEPDKLELGRWQIVINEAANYNILDNYLLQNKNKIQEKKNRQKLIEL
ncbi:hypothetical protein PPERSA_09400 [Pseudocohnilembus persalinus]|uniref:Tubulin-tyrosine ligase/Tubulin polyglutamylase n=1 Tax=Pseudocohnilembus persalinus TaxID=266149 RepID=A0A0V0R507_PSEPJ|nr:hypothetical protein PPERSA_09400 [Pseudocohnilembus persalinus]|eukprot:KRX09570.1 hypothetical protein PPERSA_09400 [Pseudocohnilembus persalinus]